jgi:hypothetical protein
MIRIELTDDDFSRTRLALSPLWELVASLFLLHRDEPPAEHRAWVERTRRTLAGRTDLGPLDLGVSYAHCCPDFMAPVPVDPLADVEEEIERVRATEPDAMAADIAECWPDGPPPPWDRFAAHPREMADRLAEGLHAYWQAALADEWPRLRAVLEGEVLGRARSLALSGPAAVLDELHPRVRWRAPMLDVLKGPEHPIDVHLAGRPLVLIPLVYEGGVLVGSPHDGNAIAIGYQAAARRRSGRPMEMPRTSASSCCSDRAAPPCCARSPAPRPRPSSRPGCTTRRVPSRRTSTSSCAPGSSSVTASAAACSTA